MAILSHPRRGLRVDDLQHAKLVNSNPNSPFVKDGYRSGDMHDTEVNEHIEDLMSFANNIDKTPGGQTTDDDAMMGEEEFTVSDGQGGFVVNLGHTFEGTDDRTSYSRNSSTSDKTVPSPHLKKLVEGKAKRDRKKRQEMQEEDESWSFFSWCCASSRTEDSTTNTAPQEHN